ncbi:hypothetical protein [Pseudogemmobacter faecipullorum]|uniref:Uncharacterized protein n=1 Tax=Pseudogemmobacter faecipullorum TaxID=2755041 RepID=A0ABS8CKL1_9RHOB|nr:hypothetical protein [Pseudogemmobacter faecipullorum]MCB5409915.1 hypothetical protein [Pseudogemmobacter faecipullorum]
MLRRAARLTASSLFAAGLTSLSLALPAPVQAQILYEDFAPKGEVAEVKGPWARYQTHVLKLGKNRYAVLFRPGFIHAKTALNAISPLCAAQDMHAVLTNKIAPVVLVLANGEDAVQQGYHVDCVAKE